MTAKPLIALAMGDPAGISPELTAKLTVQDDIRAQSRLVVIGDRRIFDAGARIAGVKPELTTVEQGVDLRAAEGEALFIDLGHLDPKEVEPKSATLAGGKFALTNYKHALELGRDGRADAVCFTPFNKQAMRLARAEYDDEIAFSAEVVGLETAASEFNVLDRLWNARVTSHMPLKDVAGRLSSERIHRALELTDSCMRKAGFARPRIAVAGLNPHAGDGGNFGREEIDIIAPVVAAAQRQGIAAEGPFPADTVFLRAKGGAFDAVLTMYHDQGQIAMKLMGFDRGVTLLGGFPFPICTPAHGTAYDIAGQGVASIGASRAALLLAAEMAATGKRPG
ncbi:MULTISPECIES: 4-hydroxythreonine-4-phosphate dehydrogenase PdxA [unclassified Bradyrhizobium]|uniref:4-hydroxythreonine-4-phosphate dehydrogenase PdxA n=1 Tax=unclassified Bradyrhizobium TaxID=2631580 RepID=UPI001FF69DA5|nr:MULTISPECIES: 4-hydroxythreonine-4-phosphate dehydrogenase PdxA [unclassified Bradyrhizobium]MCJ9700770.1 4-hydroxythreonine-4-phosphate dehydrogenase PdxA [Bradyrhizobium sp. SHOUNA76]MCJ9729289.1 4-hydroxythreonine-4-phosphate dehydrogenase PdxA [Bradyrhizobium sp. PRIMUS42]